MNGPHGVTKIEGRSGVIEIPWAMTREQAQEFKLRWIGPYDWAKESDGGPS